MPDFLPLRSLVAACALATAAAAQAEVPDPVPGQDPGPLPRFEALTEGCFYGPVPDTNDLCGYVVVPAARNADGTPNGTATVHVAVLVLRPDTPSDQDPLFLTHGGPGGSIMPVGLGAQYRDDPWLTRLGATRDIVLIDQRGSGASRPLLDCDAYGRARIAGARAGLDAATQADLVAVALAGCADALKAAGHDAADFNSAEIAADMDAVRQALGYDRMHFYGQSSGTFVAQNLMRDFPASLRSVILDGPYPAALDFGTGQAALKQASWQKVIDACAAEPACDAAHAGFADRLEAIHAALKDTPATLTLNFDELHRYWDFLPAGPDGIPLSTLPLTAEMFSLATFSALYTPGGLRSLPGLPEAFAADPNTVKDAALFLLTYWPVQQLAHFTVTCGDKAGFDLADVGLEQASPLIRDYVDFDTRQYAVACARLDLPRLPDRYHRMVESAVPTLILTGAFDAATPEALLDLILPGLPNATVARFGDGAHVQLTRPETCADQLIIDFVTEPEAKPDLTCAQALSFSFAGE
ncbi:alpha/beta hydrolase [Maliponia aquimaris]|uniref:Carboxylesterase A n=1 Tax=Maliponia aquimaris TaxID=1673631 RepID=A0A238K784_9RHOB|nr:alpha/beta fold hydrolase [Maliponia aquimaris]SMX38719.1 Carboxylesterase A precursor [Maliponia aquimaris]